jgi:hypothetical protein
MQDVGVVARTDPVVVRPDGGPMIYLAFRGLRDSRTSTDRDKRVRITMPTEQAGRLWELLGALITDDGQQ